MLQGHLDSLHAVTFDKKRVFTAGVEAKIYLWDVRSGHFVASLTGHKVSVATHIPTEFKHVMPNLS